MMCDCVWIRFECTHCFVEIPNDYMHCVGCELLRWADYNLCIPCFQSYKMCATRKLKSVGEGPYASANNSGSRNAATLETGKADKGRISDECTVAPSVKSTSRKASAAIASGGAVARDAAGECRASHASIVASDGTMNGRGSEGSPRHPEMARPTSSVRRRFEKLSANTRRSHWVPEPGAATTCPLVTKAEDLPMHERAHHRGCTRCNQCTICACLCHLEFALRCRFEPNQDIRGTLNQARVALGH